MPSGPFPYKMWIFDVCHLSGGHLAFISVNRLKSKYYRISVQADFILFNKRTQKAHRKIILAIFLCYFYNFLLLVFLWITYEFNFTCKIENYCMWRVDSTHIQAIRAPKKQGMLLLFADQPTHFLLLLTEAMVISIVTKIRIQRSMKCL